MLLDNLHVLAPWQGTGAGKLLMRRATGGARGARQIHLYALEGNTRAIAFYERQGWTLSGVEDDEIAGIRARRGATSIRCSAWRPNSGRRAPDNSIRFRSGSRR